MDVVEPDDLMNITVEGEQHDNIQMQGNHENAVNPPVPQSSNAPPNSDNSSFEYAVNRFNDLALDGFHSIRQSMEQNTQVLSDLQSCVRLLVDKLATPAPSVQLETNQPTNRSTVDAQQTNTPPIQTSVVNTAFNSVSLTSSGAQTITEPTPITSSVPMVTSQPLYTERGINFQTHQARPNSIQPMNPGSSHTSAGSNAPTPAEIPPSLPFYGNSTSFPSGLGNLSAPISIPPPIYRAALPDNGQRNNRMHHLKGTDIQINKYTGSDDTRTPYDFLVELEKFQSVLGYSEREMLGSVVPMFLTGEAYFWYRNEVIPFMNWEDFKHRLRQEFQTAGYEQELRKQLDARTQGPDEPLTSFIRVINELFDRLGDRFINEGERVHRILRQMHPEYRHALQGKQVNTMQELRVAAHSAQELIKAYRSYVPPPQSAGVEPSLAYRGTEAVQQNATRPVTTSGLQRSAFDPFGYHQAQKKGVSFSQPLIQGGSDRSRSPLRAPPTPIRSSSPVVHNHSQPVIPQRSRSSSPARNNACFVCGEVGHYANECPKKSGNYRSPSPARR